MSRASDKRNVNSYSTGGNLVPCSFPCHDMVEASHQNYATKVDHRSGRVNACSNENKSLKRSKKHYESSSSSPTTNNIVAKTEPDDADLFKTELCRSWEELGRCKYGLRCKFAHGSKEIRPLDRHPRYKTTPCRQFHTCGFCSYGSRCHFIHGEADRLLLAFLLTAVELEKTRRGNSKLDPEKNLDPDLKSSFKSFVVESSPSIRSHDLKINNSNLQNTDPARVRSLAQQTGNTSAISTQFGSRHQTRCMDDVQNQFSAHHFLENNWTAENFSKLRGVQNDCLEGSLDQNIHTKILLENDFVASLLINRLPNKFADQIGFEFPQNTRSRTSSGDSFGDEFDLTGIHSFDTVGDERQLRHADLRERLVQHQHFLDQRQILEDLLVDTLRRMQGLSLESSVNNFSKTDSDGYGKIFDCLDASNARHSDSTLKAFPLDWNRTHSIDSSSVSSGSPPNIHWTDPQLEVRFI